MPEATTPTTEILRLLTALLDEHSAGEASVGEFRVVAVVTDDAPGIAAIAPAILRQAGGTMLVASECADGVPSTRAPDGKVRAAVRKHLKVPEPGGHLVPQIERREGRIHPSFKNRLLESENKGHRELLGFAASLFHEELREVDIALLLIDETPLEQDVKRAVWNFCTELLPTLGLQKLRTLIVVLQAATIDHGRHCEGEGSARFALTRGIMRRRYPLRQPIRVNQLANDDQPLVLFLGAGFSVSSQMPLGDELRDIVLGRLLQDPAADVLLEASRLPRMFYDWVKQEGALRREEQQLTAEEFCRRLTLERVIAEEIRPSGRIERSCALPHFKEKHDRAVGKPGAAILELAKIVRRRGDRALVLVTVNFDELLESQCGEELDVAATPDEFRGMAERLPGYMVRPKGKVPYLKLHGTISKPSSITASVNQTQAGLDSARSTALRLLPASAVEAPRKMIYVGYSMRDLDLEPWLGDRALCDGVEEWWVQPFLDANVAAFVERFRVQAWAAQPGQEREVDKRMITETADTFFTTLASCWPT